MLAGRIGMDPFEFRYINVAREGDTCTTSVPYREYPMRAMMDMLRPHYRKAVEKARAESTPEHRRGVGCVGRVSRLKSAVARKSIWS